MLEFTFTAPLWRHTGSAAWFFVSLPIAVADAIADHVTPGPGFGSVPVTVQVGGTSWRTSIFPDAAGHTYVLPVKKSVRAAEGLADGTPVRVHLSVLVAAEA